MSSFIIELTRNGKPNVVYKNYKYRESYTVQSGETIWRCLGRDCGASIKTDVGRTSVKVTKAKHTGPHPVTMRSLTSSTPRQHRATSATSSPAPVTPPAGPTTVTTKSATPDSQPIDTSQQPSTPGVADLAAENNTLKEKILHLEEELLNILDHSIESDTRLMQYTNEVFVSNSSRIEPPVRASVADCAVQCDPLIRASAADCAVQCDLPTSCRDEQCNEVKALVQSLKTTIEVLEAELLCLKAEAKTCECRDPSAWTVRLSKRKHLPTSENRYQALSATNVEPIDTTKPSLEKKPSGITKRNRRKKPRSRPTERSAYPAARDTISITQPLYSKTSANLSFSSVIIEGDSHSRDLAGHVKRMLSTRTSVTGNCKPGAKLISVVSDQPPPPGSCTVIIAGTNDLADSQQHNIYRHLERSITTKLRTSKVVIATLPYRHDLPASHPIHLETALVNAYIEELCARHRGAEVLNFNTIGRSAFTNQGMHLKPKCKRLLAELLVECLQKLDGDDYTAPPPAAVPTVVQPPTPEPVRSRQPPVTCETPERAERAASTAHPPPTTSTHPDSPRTFMLPHDTYADAVKLNSPQIIIKPFLENNVLKIGLD